MMPALLAQGFELLIYGMGTVILFLSLLVVATRAMSWAVLRYFPQTLVAVPESRRARADQGREPGCPASSPPSPELLAAISAAVHRHRLHQQQRPH
ncbi:MAG: oxaloacetate decarboxylase gamma subunit [Halieaceae bacterium]|jgi:oxaloacetate decarboxylase gamma subunit